MKNTMFLFIATLFLSVAVSAQSTVDSIRAKYQLIPMPEALTLEKAFPAIGTYQLSAVDGSSQSIQISIDSVNKGMVWVDGLPEGRFKAFLKQSPATYRIIAQKSESGVQIPEGTLHFDQANGILNVVLGKKFDESDPTAVFQSAVNNAEEAEVKVKTKKNKSKTKVVFYNATRVEQETTASHTMQDHE